MVQSSHRSPPTAAADRFLDAVSRELREPLGGVMAVAGLLQRQVSPDSQAYVRMIVEHTEAMMRTIDDAKDLIQSESGALSLDPRPASLRELMDALQAYWQPRAEQAGVTLLVSYDGEDLYAVIDGRRIRQIFDHDFFEARERDGTLDRVPELADVAGPRVAHQTFGCGR